MTLLRLLLVLVAIASAGAPTSAGDEQDCFQSQEPELRIKGCSELIERAPKDPAGYHNRAVAYSLAGDVDRAIADYTKVIEMAPDNASAYDSRGRAYASKGDYAHAVEDQTKAQTLLAKAIAQPTVVTPKDDVSASAPKKAKPPSKAKAPPKSNNSVAQEEPASGFWFWLAPGNTNTNQPGAKKSKQ